MTDLDDLLNEADEYGCRICLKCLAQHAQPTIQKVGWPATVAQCPKHGSTPVRADDIKWDVLEQQGAVWMDNPDTALRDLETIHERLYWANYAQGDEPSQS